VRGISEVRLTGAIAGEPQLDTVGNGLARLRFTLAGSSNRFSNGEVKQVTAYTDITYLGDLATQFAEQFADGSLVDVRGRLDYSRYEVEGQTRTSLRVLALRLTELDPALHELDVDSKQQAVLKNAINRVQVYGNLTRDAELRYTPNGDPIARFSVAVNERYRDRSGQDQERVAFVDVEAWHDLARAFVQSDEVLLTKGMPVIVEGLFLSDNYQNKEGEMVYRKKVEAQHISVVSSPSAARGA